MDEEVKAKIEVDKAMFKVRVRHKIKEIVKDMAKEMDLMALVMLKEEEIDNP